MNTTTAFDSPLFEIRRTRAVDRTGQRYGRLTALEPTPERRGGGVVWRCRCDCGNETLVRGTYLANGTVLSCGCLKKETLAQRATDHTAHRYGKLTALEAVDDRRGGGVVWRCRCDCGNETLVRGNLLTTGKVRSCGHCRSTERERVMRELRRRVANGARTDVILDKLRSYANG